MRYRIVLYKKAMKNYILNRMEKNNVQLIYETLADLRCEERNGSR